MTIPIPEVAARLAKYEARLKTGALMHALYGAYRDAEEWIDAVNAHRADLRALLADHAALTAERDRLAGAREVDFYEREFYPLSNFSSFNLDFGGRVWPTSEHAYHGMKFAAKWAQAAVFNAPSAHEAFKFAERNKANRRPEWDDIKVDIMRRIIRAKAEQHEYVRRKLLETGERPLIEGSWRDDFWGVGPNRDGQNMLGKLWMELRAALTFILDQAGRDAT